MRRTGMFYIWIQRADEWTIPHTKKRLFIGTAEEAMDELKEEVKTLYPDDYDRLDRNFWSLRRTELLLYMDYRTQVTVRDPLEGTKCIRKEFSGGWKDED